MLIALGVKKSEKNKLDLPQVDCKNAKVSDSQDNQREGQTLKSTCSTYGILHLYCILLARKKKVGVTIFDNLRCLLVTL